MSHNRPLAVRCRFWIGHTAVGIACVVSVVPASYAQDPQVLVHRTSAATGNEAEEPQTHEEMSDGLRTKKWKHMGAFVAEPIGRFWVGPEFVGGETVYVLRAPLGPRIASVEVSATPFTSELTGGSEYNGSPDEQPADW